MQTTKPCSKCGETKPLSDFNKGKGTKLGVRSACKECESKSSKLYRKYEEYTCTECKEPFSRRKDLKNKKTCTKCSRKIAGINQIGKIIEKARKGKYVTCDNCGKEHYKRLSQLKKGHKHVFCNNKCNGQWSAKNHVPKGFISSVNNAGKNNGRYKHGKRVGGHDRHKNLKKKLIARDGNGCVLCGNNDKIHVHRVIPGGLGGKYELNNTIMLCDIHHDTVHKDYDLWKPRLLKIVQGEDA